MIKFERLGKMSRYQDGSIFGDLIFRFSTRGVCEVVRLETFEKVGEFKLDKTDFLVPHSNSVCFGPDPENGEFPLLYTNIYNNCQNDTDKKAGVCCVYAITERDGKFESRLVQTIKIGFTEKRGLWRSASQNDVRPYGNFTVDPENRSLWVFTMIDEHQVTRFFEFKLPDIRKEKVILSEDDIISRFDGEYSHFLQGACMSGKYILSVEGFSDCPDHPAALKIFDTEEKTTVFTQNFVLLGYPTEPEFIDVYKDEIYYSDGAGEFFKLRIEK